jgi:hypothetical protein
MIRDNEIAFVDANQSPAGPLKYMSEAARDRVHQEIDIRMQELEDTGLSRNEILFEEQKGLSLKDDPFFQYVKNSRTAREMLLAPSEELTADRVIELALRQDVKPDGSASMNRQNYQLYNDENQQPMWEYKKKYRDKSPLLNSDAYFAESNGPERRKRLFDFEKEKPATFINKPLNRS